MSKAVPHLASENTWDKRNRYVMPVFSTKRPMGDFDRVKTQKLDRAGGYCYRVLKPSPIHVSHLMTDLLRNLEGRSTLSGMFYENMMQAHLISPGWSEQAPNLEQLLRAPELAVAEPQLTVPRLVALAWLVITDYGVVESDGWCGFKQIVDYVASTRAREISQQMTQVEDVLAHARFIMEDFIEAVISKEINGSVSGTEPKIGDQQRYQAVDNLERSGEHFKYNTDEPTASGDRIHFSSICLIFMSSCIVTVLYYTVMY